MKMKYIFVGALILMACLVPGCLGDKIVGSWDYDITVLGATVGTVVATFNSDNTGNLVLPGNSTYNFTWEKANDTYTLKDPSDDTVLATAVLKDDDTLVMTSSLLGWKYEFDRIKK